MVVELWWDLGDVAHIRSRSRRYPGATDIDSEWTLQAAADPAAVVRGPDPKSKAAYIRLVGYSPAAGFVLTVIIDPHGFSGVTACKTRGADLRDYLDRKDILMSNSDHVARRTRHGAILAEVAVEEAEAAEAEAVEKTATLDVPMHLRIDSELDRQLRQRAGDEQIPTSALVRRLLRQALQEGPAAMSAAEVEGIARRVAREEFQNH